MDLGEQRRIGGLGGVRAQARPAPRRCRRCCASSVKSVPIARSTVSSVRSSWNSSTHGATSQTAAAAGPAGRAEPDLALARQPVVRRRAGRWPPSARRSPGRAAAPATSRGLAALAAGVEHPDLGVGELGRARPRSSTARDTCSPSLGWRRVGGGGGGGLHAAASAHVGRPVQRDHPHQQRSPRPGTPNSMMPGMIVAPAERATVLVEGRALGDLSDHGCTLEPPRCAPAWTRRRQINDVM